MTQNGLPKSLENMRKVMSGVELILEGLGCDTNSPDFRETPERVAMYYSELLTPAVNTWATFPGGNYDQMVVLRGYDDVAICPHHLLPVEITCHVAYVPDSEVVGLSKLARAVQEQLTRPITQEELTKLVAEALMSKLNPKGVGVVIVGRHGCMKHRGIKSVNSDVVTSMMRGCFFTEAKCRDEFMQLVMGR